MEKMYTCSDGTTIMFEKEVAEPLSNTMELFKGLKSKAALLIELLGLFQHGCLIT